MGSGLPIDGLRMNNATGDAIVDMRDSPIAAGWAR